MTKAKLDQLILDDEALNSKQPVSLGTRITENQKELDKILGMIKGIGDGMKDEQFKPI